MFLRGLPTALPTAITSLHGVPTFIALATRWQRRRRRKKQQQEGLRQIQHEKPRRRRKLAICIQHIGTMNEGYGGKEAAGMVVVLAASRDFSIKSG
jgi:hypothetical protein